MSTNKLSRDILNKNIIFCHPQQWAPAAVNYELDKYYQSIYLHLTETQTSGPPL